MRATSNSLRYHHLIVTQYITKPILLYPPVCELSSLTLWLKLITDSPKKKHFFQETYTSTNTRTPPYLYSLRVQSYATVVNATLDWANHNGLNMSAEISALNCCNWSWTDWMQMFFHRSESTTTGWSSFVFPKEWCPARRRVRARKWLAEVFSQYVRRITSLMWWSTAQIGHFG